MVTRSQQRKRSGGATKPARRRAPREPLSRDRIVDAALHLAEREGVDALSMRALGAELGADPMAVYHYFSGKEEIIAALAVAIFRNMPHPDPSAPWKKRVRENALRYRDLACAYPRLVVHLVTHPPSAVAAVLPGLERLYAALADAGLPPQGVARAADFLIDLVNGHAVGASSGRNTRGRSDYARVLADSPPDRYPTIRGLLQELTDDDMRLDLEAELDFALAGIEAMARRARNAGRASARRGEFPGRA